jgi:hypothetical protein
VPTLVKRNHLNPGRLLWALLLNPILDCRAPLQRREARDPLAVEESFAEF